MKDRRLYTNLHPYKQPHAPQIQSLSLYQGRHRQQPIPLSPSTSQKNKRAPNELPGKIVLPAAQELIDAVDRMWLPAHHSVPKVAESSHKIAFDYTVPFGFKGTEISTKICLEAIHDIPLEDPDDLLWQRTLDLNPRPALSWFGIHKSQGKRYIKIRINWLGYPSSETRCYIDSHTSRRSLLADVAMHLSNFCKKRREHPLPLADFPCHIKREVARTRLSSSQYKGLDDDNIIIRGLCFDQQEKVWIPEILFSFLDHDDPVRQVLE